MQSYNLKLTAAASQASYVATADLFVYESGTSAGDTRIRVKPDSGNEIVLRPGQRFRLTEGEKASQWLVRSFDGASVIDGAVIIGSGEFDDANTNNIVTLAEGFSNNVRVNNTTAERVPVTLDSTQTMPVSMTGTKITNTQAERVPVSFDPGMPLSTSDNLMAYTHSKKVGIPATTQTALITPAENVNGIIIEQMITQMNAVNLLAKAGMPAGTDDGDMIEYNLASGKVTRRFKLAPGKGLYCYSVNSGTVYLLYTVL